MTNSKSTKANLVRAGLLTLVELADALRISKYTAYRLVEARAIAFHKVGGALRFRSSDVESYLDRQRVAAKHDW